MTDLCIVLSVVCLFLGFSNWIAWQEGFASGRSKARRDWVGIDNKLFIPALTRHLDIQADGGDSPEAFVEWAVKESIKEQRK